MVTTLTFVFCSSVMAAPSFEEGHHLLDERRDREALEVFRQAGHAGDIRAARMAGIMYLWGESLFPGVRALPDVAIRWLRLAALGGDPVARDWLSRKFEPTLVERR